MPFAGYFSSLASHVETIIAVGGYPFLFFAVLLEGLPLIGTAVPGHVALIAAGFLVKVGVLDIWGVLGISVSAAVLGDYIGFELGRKYGLPLIDRLKPYFFIRNKHIKKAQDLIHSHTGKAMILGRFSPMTRALMPFLVGASYAPAKKFWIFNLIGGISWAVLSIAVGYAFGAGYSAGAGYFGKIALFAIIFAIVIIWGYRFVNMRFHLFRRYELFTLTLNILSLWGFAETVQLLSTKPFRLGFDIWVNSFMDMHNHGIWGAIAAWIGYIGGTWPLGVAGGAVMLVFLFRKRWRSAGIMLLSVASTAFAIGFLKEFFMSPRPSDALQVLVDPSFPSGHAAMAAAFFVAFSYVCLPSVRSWVRRELSMVASVILILVIGISRVVLNVHWASDVIAGWCLGIFLATASILLVKYAGIILMNKMEGGS